MDKQHLVVIVRIIISDVHSYKLIVNVDTTYVLREDYVLHFDDSRVLTVSKNVIDSSYIQVGS